MPNGEEQGQGSAATAETQGTYCCKWCEGGVVKKGYGSKPCDEWSTAGRSNIVKCSDADPDCSEEEEDEEGGGGGDTLYIDPNAECPAGYEDGGIVELPIDECKSECRKEYVACRREARKNKDASAESACQTEYQTCLNNCSGGEKIKKKKCIKGAGEGEGDCPEGQGPDEYTGCPCGKQYATMTGECPAGYAFVPRTGTGWKHYKEGAKGRCECIKWCVAINCGTDCQSCKGGGGTGGEFKWSGGLSGALEGLLARLNELLGMKRGTTEEERQRIINYAAQGTKRAERGRLQSARDTLARMGLLGSGFELSEEEAIKRGTSENLANIRTQVAIDELDRRFKELMGTTGMAQSLAQLLMGSEQIPEALSAARRAEGTQSMQALMQYLSMLMGSQSNIMPFLQAIMSQGQGQGGSDWMTYLMYLLGDQFQNRGGLTRR